MGFKYLAVIAAITLLTAVSTIDQCFFVRALSVALANCGLIARDFLLILL